MNPNSSKMVCIKKMNFVGGLTSNITPGKKYNVIKLPIRVNECDEIQEPFKQVIVLPEDINTLSDDITFRLTYPLEAFVTLDEWREIQLSKIL